MTVGFVRSKETRWRPDNGWHRTALVRSVPISVFRLRGGGRMWQSEDDQLVKRGGRPVMPRTSDEFWQPLSKQEQESRPKVTPKLVEARKSALGIRFPETLLKIFRKQNGGRLTYPEFLVGGKTYHLPDIPPLVGNWRIESLAEEYPDHAEAIKDDLGNPELIFPMFGDGQWFIALDYRDTDPDGEPSILYLDIERGVRMETIAGSFDEFLSGHQTGNQRLAVRFDEIDPTTVIGQVDLCPAHKQSGHAITYQAKLSLTDTQVLLYARETWEQPTSETWTKYVAELVALNEAWLQVDTGHEYFADPMSTLVVYVDTAKQPIVGMLCERTKTKGWKNLPCKGRNHFQFASTDETMLNGCREKILEANKAR